MSSPQIKRKLAAIMFTDIAGFTALSSKDEDGAFKLIEIQREIIKPIVDEFDGDWLKEMGDGLVLSFPSSLQAVKCAIKIQHSVSEIQDLNLRIGIHQGDILEKDGDIYGDDVNVASRIEPFAAVGGIAISDKVQRDIASHPEFDIQWIAQPSLKGVLQEIKIYCIASHNLPTSTISANSGNNESKSTFFNLKKLPQIGFLILIIIILGYNVNKKLFQDEDKQSMQTTHEQITFTGKSDIPKISPSGNLLMYVDYSKENNPRLFLKNLNEDSSPIDLLPKDSTYDWIFNPEWSQNGEKILIVTRKDNKRSVMMLPKLGGNPQYFPFGWPYNTWNPDNSKIASTWMPGKEIHIIDIATGIEDTIINLPVLEDHIWIYQIEWSPNGNLLLVNTEHKDRKNILWVYNFKNSSYNIIVSDSLKIISPNWSSKGDAIYFMKEKNQLYDLYKLGIDTETGKSDKTTKLILASLNHFSSHPWEESFSVSKADNKLIHLRGFSFSNLVSIQIVKNGENYEFNQKQLTYGTAHITGVSISPDGLHIAFSKQKRGNVSEIYMMSINGENERQLTFFDAKSTDPSWSPDGKEIAFGSDKDGQRKVWKINIITNQLYKFSTTDLSQSHAIAWAPGEKILYQQPGNANWSIFDPIIEEESDLLDTTNGWLFDPIYSNDGKKIVVNWNRLVDSEDGNWIIDIDSKEKTFLGKDKIDHSNYAMDWIEDNNHLIIIDYNKNQIKQISINGGNEKILFTLPEDFPSIHAISYSENIYIAKKHETQTDIWLINNFDSDFKKLKNN